MELELVQAGSIFFWHLFWNNQAFEHIVPTLPAPFQGTYSSTEAIPGDQPPTSDHL